jgi:hypothetical protein
MIDVGINIRLRPDFAEIAKQLDFGTALGLTNTAKQGQEAVVKALGDTFTLRGGWYLQSNKYGIRIVPARKDKLESHITTAADWLELHEDGGTKTAEHGRLAIPTDNVRRNKRLVIPRGQRPAALRGKRTFVLQTKHGAVLFQRKGKGKRSKIVALYNLEPKAQIKKQSTFYEPIENVVDKNLAENILAGIEKAFATGGVKRGRVGGYGSK